MIKANWTLHTILLNSGLVLIYIVKPGKTIMFNNAFCLSCLEKVSHQK